jgi:prephenate dehydrogenase
MGSRSGSPLPLHRQNLSCSLNSLAIFGPGLIGGSLLLAWREKFPQCHLQVWGRNSSSFAALRPWLETQPEGSVSLCLEAAEAVQGAEGVVLCTPVENMAELMREASPHLAANAWVTDAGSVKSSVVEDLEALLGGRFVGAHPMAGSEKSGFAAARADLFQGSLCFLTPTPQSEQKAVDAVRDFWQAAGCRTETISPAQHDQVMARVSHLPHAVAALLCLVPQENDFALAGPGFRDTTRVAAGSPALWTGILQNNRAALLESLTALQKELSTLREALEKKDAAAVLALLDQAAINRNLLP